ncbi:MAG: hypothetical protein RBJ76_03210 [Stenomitos frigidus ULC029]
MSSVTTMQNAVEIVRQADAQMILRQFAAIMFRKGCCDAAIALFRSVPWWEEDRILGIRCQTAEDVCKVRSQYELLGLAASQERLKKVLLTCRNSGRVAQIPVSMTNANPSEEREAEPMNDRQLDLLGADYRRILELLMQMNDEGKIVIITSNVTNICLHTSSLLKPSRAVWSPNQFTGYNYLKSWRLTRDDESRLNPQFDRLQALLQRDGQISNYEYTLYRPDGALCSYSTDYFLCNNYNGDQVRIGISKPEDWSLLELAPTV